jgi:hypothetical protein
MDSICRGALAISLSMLVTELALAGSLTLVSNFFNAARNPNPTPGPEISKQVEPGTTPPLVEIQP